MTDTTNPNREQAREVLANHVGPTIFAEWTRHDIVPSLIAAMLDFAALPTPEADRVEMPADDEPCTGGAHCCCCEPGAVLAALARSDSARVENQSTGIPESTGQEPGSTDTTLRLRRDNDPDGQADTKEQAYAPAGCDGPVDTVKPTATGGGEREALCLTLRAAANPHQPDAYSKAEMRSMLSQAADALTTLAQPATREDALREAYSVGFRDGGDGDFNPDAFIARAALDSAKAGA